MNYEQKFIELCSRISKLQAEDFEQIFIDYSTKDFRETLIEFKVKLIGDLLDGP